MRVLFYSEADGVEPVKKWLHKLTKRDRRIIGEDIKIVELGWPMGFPKVKPVDKKLWEIKSKLKDREARIIFTINGDQIILLHGFIKKTQKTPKKEKEIAKQRQAKI
jgi:phage-related protein